jgi:hypothetical protein
MEMQRRDDMARDQILLSRIALLESRLMSLAGYVVPAADASARDDFGPGNFVIDAESQLELGSGFHLREWDSQGNAYRWAGRDEYFEFRFFLDRRSANEFCMRGVLADGVDPSVLRAYADYRPIPIRIRPDGGMMEVSGRVPADPLVAGVTLTFFCEPVAASGGDVRRLSFAFSSLAVGDAERCATAAPASAPCRNSA